MRLHRLVAVLFLGSAGLACGRTADAQPSRPGSARPAPSTGGAGLVVGGEHFTLRRVIDRQQHNLPAEVFLAPQTWTDRSEVLWNYANGLNPADVAFAVENPASDEAVFGYPAAQFFVLPGGPGVFRMGQTYNGVTLANPTPPAQTLAAFAQRARGGLPGFRVVGTRDMPKLLAARQMDASQHPHGVAVRVAYEMRGKPVEEEFYAAYYLANVCSNSPGGRACQTFWGLWAPHSFRAPAGTLERRLPVFSVVAGSGRINPAWQRRVGVVRAQLIDQFNRSIRAGYDEIASAKRVADQIHANSDAFLANVDRQMQASRMASAGSAAAGPEGRSENDKFDDNMRGVTTVDDPYWGTSQQDANYQYHWTDGYNTYRDSNDVTYDPNKTENGNWQLMQESR